MKKDYRLYSPAALRNREVILAFLKRYLPNKGKVLEVASGTGEHIFYFAKWCSPDLVFQPTDPDKEARASVDAWVKLSNLQNICCALALDTTDEVWQIKYADVVLCINMIHITPWAATKGLFRGASRVLSEGGMLYIYGPFKVEGRYTSESNEAFNTQLRNRNPEWGVRNLEEVTSLAVVPD